MNAPWSKLGGVKNETARLGGYCLLATIIVFGAATPARPQGKSKGGCSDIPLQVTISGVADPWNGGIYGDERDQGGNPDSTRESTYSDGTDSVSARILVCDGSKDVVLNLQNSRRSFTVDFSKSLVGADPGEFQPSGPIGGWFMKIFGAAISGGQLDTWMPVNVNLPSGSIVYCNPDLRDPLDANASLCSGGRQQLANTGGATSIVRVTVATGCTSWTIAPIELASGSHAGSAAAGLIEQSQKTRKPSLVFGGLYSMPFTVTLTRADGGGCSGL